MLIEVGAIVVGRGPGPLTVAKMLAGQAIPCLLAGHEPAGGDELVSLDDTAVAALAHHRLLDILVPYLAAGPSRSIAAVEYEHVVKHHCVADINVTVYDNVAVIERRHAAQGVEAVLTDGRSRWDLRAQWFVDGEALPTPLSQAIVAAAKVVDDIVTYAARPCRHGTQ